MPVAHVLLTEAQVEGVEQRVVFEFHRRALGLERVLVRGRADDDSAQAAELPAHGVERGVGGQEGDNKQGGKAREAREGFHGKRGVPISAWWTNGEKDAGCTSDCLRSTKSSFS